MALSLWVLAWVIRAYVAPLAPGATCAERLLARDSIDISPAPQICADLEAALDLLPPIMRAEVHGLQIARTAPGPCGETCPDLATALLSDGALAFYRIADHALHVLDAFIDGPRWRSPAPGRAAIRTWLDELGLSDWNALVAQMRMRPCFSLPEKVPEGDPLVFHEIVRCGAPLLLGGPVVKRDLLLHELAHAVQLRARGESARVRAWATLSQWFTPSENEPSDGYVRGIYASERAIVASQLALGLPRGEGCHYVPDGALPTPYAGFDPMEDFAESLRLALTRPEALGRVSPAKLLVLGAGVVDFADPRFAPFLAPGATALLAPGVDPHMAMETLRAHAKVLATQPALLDALHNAAPPPSLKGLHPEVREASGLDRLTLVIEGRTLRPHDQTLKALFGKYGGWLHERDALQRMPDEP
jgi:hypothetical protein